MADVIVKLTRPQARAVCAILDERLAGSPEDEGVAMGLTKAEAKRVWDAAGRALTAMTLALEAPNGE